LENILDLAMKFYESLGFNKDKLRIIRTYPPGNFEMKNHISYDIYYDQIELGSYGIRECSFLRWCYATALAENRTSSVLKYYGLSY
jgi:hypothetical protein